MFRFLFGPGLVLAVLHLAVVTRAPAASLNPSAEYKIKAAYLYNFTKFIEWPPASYSTDNSACVIGVLEADSSASTEIAETLRGKTSVNHRPIEVRSANDLVHLGKCQIVFVAHSFTGDLGAVQTALRDQPVLLVGESSGFAQTGGTINFLIAGNAVRLEINPQRAERARLRLSGTLASIATLVRDRDDLHD